MTEQVAPSPALPDRVGYAKELDELIESAKTPVEGAGALSIVLDKALEDAESGLLLSSRKVEINGTEDYRVYSKNDIITQLKFAESLIKEGDFQTAVDAIPSANGLRAALKEVILRPGGQVALEKYLSRFETLDPSERQEIIEEVADEAIENATGVTDPSLEAARRIVGEESSTGPASAEMAEQIPLQEKLLEIQSQLDSLKEGLTDTEIRGLWQYATALHQVEFTSAEKKLGVKGQERKFAYKKLFDELKQVQAEIDKSA